MLSLDKKEANVYFPVFVVIKIALGITNAVIFFSKVIISGIGMASYHDQEQGNDQGDVTAETGDKTHVGNPTKDIGMEAHVVLRNVKPSLYENIPL